MSRQDRPVGVLYRRNLFAGKKRGALVGKTKRGKGTKILAIADRHSLPVALGIASASPHEVTLVQEVLQDRCTGRKPVRIIGDKAYDSDPLDQRLAGQDIQLIAPHRRGRKHPTQDGRPLRRYKRRWTIERFWAWLHNFRRLVVRYEFHPDNFLGFLQLACILILLRRF